MELHQSHLKDASQRGIISEQQAQALWQYLGERAQNTPGFHFTHLLYYLGGLIAIGAMSVFMTLGWERFGGLGLCCIALGYAAGCLWLTEFLLNRKGLAIPAAILATLAVVLTPLAVYGLQAALGWWTDGRVYRDYHNLIDWRWLVMEFATLVTGTLLLWRYRLPFLVMPIALTLWYMSLDLIPLLFGNTDSIWEYRKIVSLWFGLLMLMLAFWLDIRSRDDKDFGFWLYLIGVLAFWGGLSLLDSDSELNKFLYLCINLSMIALGAMLSRRVFSVCGGIGAAAYLGYLAYDVFRDSMLFPFALTCIGLGVIYLGILWQRHEQSIGRKLAILLPLPVRDLIDKRR